MLPNLLEMPVKLKSSTSPSEAAVTVSPPAAVTQCPHLFALPSSAHAKFYLAKPTAYGSFSNGVCELGAYAVCMYMLLVAF